MKNQNQWEGFQNINDHQDKITHFVNQSPNNIPETPHTNHKSKHSRKSDLRSNQKKKISQSKNSTTKDLPPSQTSSILSKQLNQKQKNIQIRNNKNQSKEEQKVELKRVRYPPIPIIYQPLEYEHRGKIIYRGLLPKTADTYFRHLKDVKWDVATEEKRFSHNLQFNSQFESGNLAMACQEYDLYMRVDTNTNGHMQWYYFSVRNLKKIKVRFNIYRFLKRYSLYQRGMRPYVRSRKSGKDWQPGGENIKYYLEKRANQNGVMTNSKYHYLTFNYTFQQENDQVFFAAGIPYTTTFLTSQINNYQKLTLNNILLKFDISPLCTSLCGQQIELLCIQPKQDSKLSHSKQFIIINARSHSGETSASWVLDGLLQSLSSDRQVQEWIINMNICFRIVPMLNKDGVFIGNYRTGIVGDDFNRKFKSGQKDFFPQIFGLKKLVSKCKKLGKVKLFLDLHGHSILKNSFIFGPDRKSFQSEELINVGAYLLNSSKYFSHTSSVYCNEVQKVETARVYFQMHEEILSLTCQNSLGLYYDQYQTFQQTSLDWKNFGKHLLQSIMKTLSSEGQLKSLQLQKKYSDNRQEKSKSKIKQNLYWIKTNNKAKNTQKNQTDMYPISNKIEHIKTSFFKGTQKSEEEETESRIHSVRLNQQQTKVEQNASSACPSYRGNLTSTQKQQKVEKKLVNLQQALQKSIVLTRYAESQAHNNKQYQVFRNSKTIGVEVLKSQCPQQQEIIPDNFSQQYQSINDSDEEIQDLEPAKREELLQWIKQINIKCSEETMHSDHNVSLQLQPVRAFKQYKIDFQNELHTEIVEKKPVSNKLRPLKYQEFKLRGFTQKKIKPNVQMFSGIVSDRMQTRIMINANASNDFRCKKSRQIKREQIIKKMFPQKQQGEYLLMRIREMKLANTRE